MKLTLSAASPFVRKVRVLIHEAGAQDAVELVDIRTTPLSTDPAVAAANPLGKIPALIRGDGTALYDSRVICRYLDDRFGAGLYGGDVWDVLRREALADGIMDAAVSTVYEARLRDEGARSAAWIGAQKAKIARALDAAEAEGPDGPVDMGRLALACALGYLDFREVLDWRADRPALAAFAERWGRRPSIAATRPG
ncbi:MAG: glutathione S-transferase N-terminal domain-containing protein [Hasllibacter sp.]